MYYHLFADLQRPDIFYYIGISMKVICIEETAFYTLLDRVFEHMVSTKKEGTPSKWISMEEAMKLLSIKSKSTLQKLRDEQVIRFSQPFKKVILYDRHSIEAFLEKYVIEPIR